MSSIGPKNKSRTLRIEKKLIKKFKKKVGARSLTVKGKSNGGSRIRGRGGYFSDAFDWGKKAWSNLNENERPEASNFNKVANKVGQLIGNEFGIGKQLGNAGSWLSRAFGMGKYTIKKNSLAHDNGAGLVQGMSCNMPPSFGTSKKGSDIIFAHREFVADVKSSIDFRATTYPINPGNPLLFPWMSQIAELYEEYEMLGMILEYKSSSGTSNTAAVPGMGLVLMATDYDPYDNAFLSKRQMEAAEFSSSGTPYSNFLHAIECDPKRNVLATQYVQPGLTNYVDAPGDARFSVLGNTTIATVGQQADNVTMGELWVTYHVRLSRPVLEHSNTLYSEHLFGTLEPTSWSGTTIYRTPGFEGFNLGLTGSALFNPASSRLTVANITNKLEGTFRITWNIKEDIVPSFYVPADLAVSVINGSVVTNIHSLGATNHWNQGFLAGGTLSYGTESCNTSFVVVELKQNATVSLPVMVMPGRITKFDLFIDRVDSKVYLHGDAPLLSKEEVSEASKVLAQCKLSKDEVSEASKVLAQCKLLKNELEREVQLAKEWTVNEEPEIVTDSAIAVLEKENIEDYTLADCKDRIESIKDLISSDVKPAQLNFLLARLQNVVHREVKLSKT